MAYQFKSQRRIEFAETDLAGIVHFANFFRFMEEVEHSFFRSLGLRVHTAAEDGALGWARGQVECRYDSPAYYEDVLDLHLVVCEKRSKSIRYQITFARDGVMIARGAMTVVHVEQVPGDPIRATAVPAEVDALVEVAPDAPQS